MVDNAIFPWVGAKFLQRKLLLDIFSKIRREKYVEPFGGSAVLFLCKEPELEVYNDINKLLVTFFRVLRTPSGFKQLQELAARQPKSRLFWREYQKIALAYYNNDLNAVKRLIEEFKLVEYSLDTIVAFSLYYCQIYGFGGKFLSAYGGGEKGRDRGIAKRDNLLINDYCQRFANVNIENLDAVECLKKYDAPTTLFYLDPPYNTQTSEQYKTGWTTESESRLVDALKNAAGSIVLSCYDSDVYKSLLDSGFQKM